jgi:hypothetical protein
VIAPGHADQVQVPFHFPEQVRPGSEYFLTLSFQLATDTLWGTAGHEVAWAQFQLPVKSGTPALIALASMPPVSFEQTAAAVRVRGADFEITFDRVRGVIARWVHEGLPVMTHGPRLNFWRAPIDNETHNAVEAEWRKFGLHWMQHRVESVVCEQVDPKTVRVKVASRVAPPVARRGFACEYVYTIFGSGDVLLEVHGTPHGDWPSTLPKIGLQMSIPGTLDHVKWLGRGPGESYPDSQQAGRIAVWSAGVDDMYTPYVMPQEYGNHTDVRWVALTGIRGMGLFAGGVPTLNFSARRFTTEDIDKARHTYDLVPRDEIELNLDYRHNGLGTGSCGPGPLPQYQVHAEEFRFAVRLRPVSVDAMCPAELAHRVPK